MHANRVTDVVCRMSIDPESSAAESQLDGRTYYFCSAGCKAGFDHNPERYAPSIEQKTSHGCCSVRR